MIRVILTHDEKVRDSLNSLLSLEKKPQAGENYAVYKRAEWILAYTTENYTIDIVRGIMDSFLPDRLYIPVIGRSVDMVHEVGDVILPNVFLTYNPLIEKADIDEVNRDSFLGEAQFLELFNEQKDYYVEDYGLSIGGIIVDNSPVSEDEMNSKLMLAYEADIYTEDALSQICAIAQLDEIPTVLSAGIIEGKIPKNMTLKPLDHTLKNMITTWRLLDEEQD